MVEIRNSRGEVIFTSKTAQTVKQAVEEAVRLGISLADADLVETEKENEKTEDIEKKESCKVLHPPIIKDADVLQPLEIIVTGKDNPCHRPGHTVFFRGVEFMVEENKSVETLTNKTQRIKLILK